jgi:hypothetical protein
MRPPLSGAHTGRVPTSDEEQGRLRARAEDKLRREQIRATLSFAAAYQITYELVKTTVLERLREFYGADLPPRENPFERARYKAEVLSLAPESYLRASLLWLVNAKAISQEQADRLEEISAHWHDLSRDLLGNVIDPDHWPDLGLLTDALHILVQIHRFWAQIAIDTGQFERFGDLTTDDLQPAWAPALWSCIAVVKEGADWAAGYSRTSEAG